MTDRALSATLAAAWMVCPIVVLVVDSTPPRPFSITWQFRSALLLYLVAPVAAVVFLTACAKSVTRRDLARRALLAGTVGLAVFVIIQFVPFTRLVYPAVDYLGQLVFRPPRPVLDTTAFWFGWITTEGAELAIQFVVMFVSQLAILKLLPQPSGTTVVSHGAA